VGSAGWKSDCRLWLSFTEKEMRPQLTVVIGIDPHKSSHTAAALDPDRHTVLDTVRVEATLVEYRRLLS
jgi:hypothetical protein